MSQSLERVVGSLEAEIKALRTDVHEVKKDVRDLLAFKWRIYGATALIAILCSGIVAIAEAFVRR